MKMHPLILGVIAATLGCLHGPRKASAACDNCSTFGSAQNWGVVAVSALTEASGVAASQRNAGVLWSHNDGSSQRLYAFSTNGSYLASFSLNAATDDLEDLAAGPGPEAGASYLYVGDIGGSGFPNTERATVRVFRVREPTVEPSWAGSPVSGSFDSVETFALNYPDGSYDAETLMFDSLSGDVFVVTKQPSGARVYRANLTTAVDGSVLQLTFDRQLNFGLASGGAISADGTRILLRREDYAVIWTRCEGEAVGAALARAGASIPLTPLEPNGEAITMLPDGTGYVTLSEGPDPALYFFLSQCPALPKFTRPLSNQTSFSGASVVFNGAAAGYPAPTYAWRFNSALIPGQTNSSLTLTGLTASHAGTYELRASNVVGVATSSATLTVNNKPDLRITEVQSSTAPSPNLPSSDWWELTSFESQPVNLAGWRFNDNLGGLLDPFTFPSGLTIAPGESIVFVEGLDATQFRAWWGAANLPPNLKIVTYAGLGLSFAATGDGIRLWNASTITAADTIASVDFGAAANGVTFNYSPASGQFGMPSQVGVNGVLKAAASADIGSPGRIYGPLAAAQLRAVKSGNRMRIEFDAAAGATYRLEAKGDLLSGQWLPTGDSVKATTDGRLSFEAEFATSHFFYRVTASR